MINKWLGRIAPSIVKSHTSILKGPVHSSTHILKALHSQAAHPPTPIASVKTYVSPYDIPAPLPFMVLYNRSPYAMQTAEDALKDAWSGSMRTIHVVPGGARARVRC